MSKVESFENELLGIGGIVAEGLGSGIDFDLSSWSSGIRYVIIVPKYRISDEQNEYFEARNALVQKILEIASRFGLSRAEDRIEDYGAHFYIVFRCDDTWPNL